MTHYIITCSECASSWTDAERDRILSASSTCPDCGGQMHILDLPASSVDVARACGISYSALIAHVRRNGIGRRTSGRRLIYGAEDVRAVQESKIGSDGRRRGKGRPKAKKGG